MSRLIEKGTWVEVYRLVLPAGERAPQVPADTRQRALEMRVKGFLSAPARLGEQAEVVTPSGRRLSGLVEAINPAYDHSFGAPIAELSAIGREVRALLRMRDRDS